MARLVCLHGGTFPEPASLDPRTAAALARYAPAAGLDVEWADTSGSLQDYAGELEKRWDGSQDLIVVEQDKQIFPETLPSLLAGCDEPWCGHTFWQGPVPHTALVHGGFGVTRFSARIQQLIRVAEFRGDVQVGIDRRFYDLLISRYGKGCHIHGHVLHHHVYRPRPAAVRQRVAELRAQGILPPAVYPEPAGPHLLPGSWDLPGRG